jgi:DNA-binding MarR family transcriptional regulator
MEHLSALMFAYRAEMRRALHEGGHELNGMEVRTLLWIARHPGGTARELAQHGGRDKAQITRVIQQLEGSGLIGREADPGDKRVQRLALSAAGQALHAALQQHRQAVSKRLLGRLAPAEQAQLGALLAKMRGEGADG